MVISTFILCESSELSLLPINSNSGPKYESIKNQGVELKKTLKKLQIFHTFTSLSLIFMLFFTVFRSIQECSNYYIQTSIRLFDKCPAISSFFYMWPPSYYFAVFQQWSIILKHKDEENQWGKTLTRKEILDAIKKVQRYSRDQKLLYCRPNYKFY
jgi:hypothetical protein